MARRNRALSAWMRKLAHNKPSQAREEPFKLPSNWYDRPEVREVLQNNAYVRAFTRDSVRMELKGPVVHLTIEYRDGKYYIRETEEEA